MAKLASLFDLARNPALVACSNTGRCPLRGSFPAAASLARSFLRWPNSLKQTIKEWSQVSTCLLKRKNETIVCTAVGANRDFFTFHTTACSHHGNNRASKLSPGLLSHLTKRRSCSLNSVISSWRAFSDSWIDLIPRFPNFNLQR